MFHLPRRVVALSLACLLSLPAIAEQPPSDIPASELLKRMTHAVRHLDYEGDFVYQTGEVLNAMHIVHTVQSGFEKEHLVTLTGPNREIIRDDYTLTRYAPDNQKFSVSERKRSQAPTLATFDPERLEPLYRIEVLGRDRVAGRDTTIVAVMPKDTYRYGHRLYLDSETALPLRRVVVDRKGSYISQIMFTTVEISAAKTDLKNGAAEAVEAVDYQGEWQFSDLPGGFVMEIHNRSEQGESGRDHFMFSDGITRLSLYIETGDSGQGIQQQSNVGGVGILSARQNDRRVTVVGEAPIETLKLFLRSVSKRGASTQ